jgi:thiol:disulfide interchange protein DsbC
MQRTIAIIAFLGLACASAVAAASEATAKAAFQKRYPDITVESVNKTPLPGIYEVYANGDLIYTDENAAYLFVSANLIDAEKKTSLSEQRLNQLTAIKFDQLPLNLAFKKVKGKGTRKLAYFGDPNCGYCKKFEQDLTKINDVTIYVFLYPVLGPNSLEKAKSIWCSKDRVKAWDDQLVNGIAPTAPGTCDTSNIDKTVAFGKQKGIKGTPTMFFADGQRVPGAIPVEMIEQHLAAVTPVN